MASVGECPVEWCLEEQHHVYVVEEPFYSFPFNTSGSNNVRAFWIPFCVSGSNSFSVWVLVEHNLVDYTSVEEGLGQMTETLRCRIANRTYTHCSLLYLLITSSIISCVELVKATGTAMCSFVLSPYSVGDLYEHLDNLYITSTFEPARC